MSPLTVEATYENGVLKPVNPLPLKEHEKVQVTICDALDPVQASYGRMGWKGDVETLRRIAMDPEFGIEECP
jgi:predicted DNA-binding antitoxin AbrB/MazE fold protein